MTILAGCILPSAQAASLPWATDSSRPSQAVSFWPGWLASVTALRGALLNQLPIGEITTPSVGVVVRQFERDWYHHVHLLPGRMALGNLLSTRVRQVEVWNAHFAPKTLSAVIGQNNGGLILAAPSNPPTTYGMLESRLHDVSIGLDGPPVIEAQYRFVFPDESPTLSITGRRVVVFGLSPDWSDGWLERLMWSTDVLTARDGTEQRIRLRANPRRSLEFSILSGRDDAALLDVLLAAWQSRVYALPIWPDKSHLPTRVAAGSTVIQVATTHLEYAADGLLVIGTDSRNTEAAEILSVASNTVTLKQPLLQTWPAGAFLVPAQTARLRMKQGVSRITESIARSRLVFDLVESSIIAPQEATMRFKSTPVWLQRPNRRRDVETEYQRLAEVLDFETGITAVDDAANRPFIRRSFDYLCQNRAEIAAFRGWLAARQGRFAAFWQPGWECSLVPTRKLLAGQTAMTVASRGYALYFNGLPDRAEAAFLHQNGQWHLRTILGFGPGMSGEEEVMTLDQPFSFDARPEDWAALYFLEKTRLDADQIELNWLTDSVVEASVPMRSCKE